MSDQSQRNPPFRAEHIGSLLRPLELTTAAKHCARGEIDEAALRAVQDRCIVESIQMQETADDDDPRNASLPR
jgi:methionine synthase II (cobalamin-independent)